MARKYVPSRAASIKARVSIGRIVKKMNVAPRYYWVTGRHKHFDEQGKRTKKGTRACVLAVGEPLTYEKLASTLRALPTTHPRTEIRGIFAIEITEEDYRRLEKYDGYELHADNVEEMDATVFPFQNNKK